MTNLAFRITFLRFEIRVPGPPTLPSSPRSGAVVLDFHGVYIAHQGETTSLGRQTIHRGDKSRGAGPVVLGRLQYSRIVVAATLPGGEHSQVLRTYPNRNNGRIKCVHLSFDNQPRDIIRKLTRLWHQCTGPSSISVNHHNSAPIYMHSF